MALVNSGISDAAPFASPATGECLGNMLVFHKKLDNTN